MFDPFRDMDRLTSQLLGSSSQARGPRWMPMDLYRTGEQYVVDIDLPGVEPGSIDLDVDGNTLTIRAERSIGSHGDVQWLAQERPSGAYMRQLTLGQGLNLEGISANYEHGVLSLTIPVSEQAKPRKIQVETSGGGQQISASQSETVRGEVTSEGSSG